MNAPAHIPAAVQSACPYCGVGCGVLARPNADGGAIVTGDPDHPANFGRLCSKGFALGETLGLENRLLYPMLRQTDGSHARTDWDTALGVVADGFKRIVKQHGPASIAFYLSGQLLTEDYYVANKLMKGFLGSANVDTNSRLCMASSVAGTAARSARTSCRATTRTSISPISSCWSARTRRGAIRSCSSARSATGATAAPSSSSSILAAPRRVTTPISSSHRARHRHCAVRRPAGASGRHRPTR